MHKLYSLIWIVTLPMGITPKFGGESVPMKIVINGLKLEFM